MNRLSGIGKKEVEPWLLYRCSVRAGAPEEERLGWTGGVLLGSGGDELVDLVVVELGLGDDGAQEYTRKGMEVTAGGGTARRRRWFPPRRVPRLGATVTSGWRLEITGELGSRTDTSNGCGQKQSSTCEGE